jgi:hypothetical protein
MYVRLNLKTIKFYLITLATDFYRQPSYLMGERASLQKMSAKDNKPTQVFNAAVYKIRISLLARYFFTFKMERKFALVGMEIAYVNSS